MSTTKFNVNEITSKHTDIKFRESFPYVQRQFSHVFTGMSGRYTRLKIVMLLAEKPMNKHQIAKNLGYDYKSIQRNITILQENNLITKSGEGYGEVYYVSNFLIENIMSLDIVIKKVEKKLGQKKSYIV